MTFKGYEIRYLKYNKIQHYKALNPKDPDKLSLSE